MGLIFQIVPSKDDDNIRTVEIRKCQGWETNIPCSSDLPTCQFSELTV